MWAVTLIPCCSMAESRPHYGGSVRVAVRDATAWRSLVFDHLTVLDAGGKPQPQLATSWESQDGDRRWQFWIRSGVRFHDGTPANAAAIAAALAATKREAPPWTTARALGDSVVFEFAEGRPQFAAELALPAYRIERATAGTGPFRYAQTAANGRTVLQANEDYWGGRPFLDAIEVLDARSDREGAAEFDLGRADVVELAPEQLRRLRAAPGPPVNVSASSPVELIALAIRPRPAALLDPRLRRALALSIDRAAIHNFVFQKQGEVAAGVLPNWVSGYAFLLPHERDLPRAQQLRRELANSPPLVVAAEERDPALQLVAERIALNARDAGLAVQAGPKENADLVVLRRPLPSVNPALALLHMAASLGVQLPERALDTPQHWYETERDLVTQYSFVPLVYLPRTFAIAPRVRNWTLAPDGCVRLQDVWVAPSP